MLLLLLLLLLLRGLGMGLGLGSSGLDIDINGVCRRRLPSAIRPGVSWPHLKSQILRAAFEFCVPSRRSWWSHVIFKQSLRPRRVLP